MKIPLHSQIIRLLTVFLIVFMFGCASDKSQIDNASSSNDPTSDEFRALPFPLTEAQVGTLSNRASSIDSQGKVSTITFTENGVSKKISTRTVILKFDDATGIGTREMKIKASCTGTCSGGAICSMNGCDLVEKQCTRIVCHFGCNSSCTKTQTGSSPFFEN